jgi:LysR family transcriptional regulator, transcriptional activator of nhaA
MAHLNYHHLHYFWRVAKIGNLTKAAQQLHVSQSALSAQIKQLEESMGQQLFSRQHRRLILTDVGTIAFSYAESIFNIGDELEALLTKGLQAEHQVIRLGMLSTMSRNFVESFVRPLMNNPKVKLTIAARGQTNLLNELYHHELDVILTNIEVRGTNRQQSQCHLLMQQPICVIGKPGLNLDKQFNESYQHADWILPSFGSPIRAAFDGLCAQLQFQPRIMGEADDMAMLRLLARDSEALAVMPDVVVKDEIDAGKLVVYATLTGLFESFYAVTVSKHIPNQLITQLIRQFKHPSLDIDIVSADHALNA